MGAALAALAAGTVKPPAGAPTPRFFTKWSAHAHTHVCIRPWCLCQTELVGGWDAARVPRSQPMTRDLVAANVGRSLKRMRTSTLDLMQFHWSVYHPPPKRRAAC
jgi:hypothetical protein